MKKIGLIYSFNAHKTAKIAKKIVENLGNEIIDEVNAIEVDEEKFNAYNYLILSVPTWFDGELPNYWDEFVPALENMDLKGKKIAIYGAGDQVGYPENFLDAVGILAEILEKQGATIIGFTSTNGYHFESSRAQRGDQFCGLALDYENQASMNKERVANWCWQLKKEFDL